MAQPFFVKNLKKFLIISIVLQCLCILFLVVTYAGNRRKSEMELAQLADRFMEKAETELQNNSTYMVQTVVLRKDYREMFQMDDLERANKISDLQMMYKLLGETANIPYNFFVYDQEKESFLELTRVKMQFTQYREIRKTIETQLNGENAINRNGVWYLADTPSGRIILSSYRYGSYVLGAWTEEAAFLSELNVINFGKNGGIAFLNNREGVDEKEFKNFGNSVLTYNFPDCNTDFSIRITISRDSEQISQLIIQMVLVCMSVFVISILIALTRYVRISFLIPAQNLKDILDKYQSTDEFIESTEKKTSLQDAYEILDKLGNSADKLITQLYTTELEKKQLEINFRNLQIRPHFFVNCLTMLSAMAQNDEVEKINKLTVCLANYYRYILHDCMDMVTVGQEISHMRDVITVNDEWNSNEIAFDCEVEEVAKEKQIPVLIISTFLENSIKHAVGQAGTLSILLQVWIGKDREDRDLFIRITDNGEGFQEEMLERFRQGIYPEEKQGRHIGINNVIQRLQLIYAGKASIQFSSGEKGGACVEIRIPQEEADETTDCR